jgi:hypothetical protein
MYYIWLPKWSLNVYLVNIIAHDSEEKLQTPVGPLRCALRGTVDGT